MCQDGGHKVCRATVMKKEQTLAKPPERSASKFLGTRLALTDTVRETDPHVVHQEIRENVDLLIAKWGNRGTTRGETRRMAQRASDRREERRPLPNGRRAPRRSSRRGWRRQEPHEDGELLHIAE